MKRSAGNIAPISGHTQPFAVLGHPIGHTLSPPMHNANFRALGMDALYLAFDVEPTRLMRVLPAMAALGFRGVNLTVPLKEVAFHGLRDLDRCEQVCIEIGLQRLTRGLEDGGPPGTAHAKEEIVDPAEDAHGLGGHAVALPGGREIGGEAVEPIGRHTAPLTGLERRPDAR